jgi:carboxyl-terminal processing protease
MKKYWNNTSKIALAIGVFVLTTAASYKDTLFEVTKNIEIFTDVYRNLQEAYVDEPEPGYLMKKAIDAMLAALDPYTVYYPESRIEEATFMQTGAYGGIGINTKRRNDEVLITDVYDGFGADKAGVLIGDAIVKIGDKWIKDLTDDESAMLIKGQPGSTVTLTLRRGKTGAEETLVVKRESVKNKDVPFYGVVPESKTGYILLEGFTQTASSEVREAFLALKKQDINSLILDLRGNGGGLLREAVSIVNFFVPKGSPIVETKGRIAEWKNTYMASAEPLDVNIPLIVLIDDHSASASEIVSGSLQDLDRAVIIGKESFGKGLVQQTVDLAYNTKMKLTIAKYYTPSGRCVQRLDYSHRDQKTGKVDAVDDQKIQQFKTKKGRPVTDGRGVLPDVTVDTESANAWLDNLNKKFALFDFVTQSNIDFNQMDTTGNFILSQSDLESFKNYLDKINFFAISEDLKAWDEYTEQLKKSKPELSAEIIALQKKVYFENNKEFDKNKSTLKYLLEREMVRRSGNPRAYSRQIIHYDPVVKKALNVFNQDYKKILLFP